MALDRAIRLLAQRIRHGARITVITGAGVSAASGIPTFRGPRGLWRSKRWPPASRGSRERRPSVGVPYWRGPASGGRVGSRLRPEELATPEAFARDPRLVWEWYAWRRERVAQARPNRAHDVLAAWSRRLPGFALITQNVDGLHERAGTKNVVQFHGSLWEVSCWEECPNSPPRWREETIVFRELPPRCAHCGGLLRPGVVWFGEPIPPEALAASLEALDCDVCLAVGTSSIVHPAAALLTEAASRGAFTAEINLEATPISAAVDLAISGPAEQVLDRVERLLAGEEPA